MVQGPNANTVGVNELSHNSEIVIAPNPFTSQTTITFSEPQKNTIIKITDLIGREIKTIVLNTANTVTIDRGDMSKGIYFVKIEDEKKNVVNRKIVVE